MYKRQVLRSIKEAALNGDVVLRKKLPPIFAHHEQLCILMVGQKRHRFLNYVLVIRARKPLIRRDHKAAIGAVERIAAAYGVEILAVDAVSYTHLPTALLHFPLPIGFHAAAE